MKFLVICWFTTKRIFTNYSSNEIDPSVKGKFLKAVPILKAVIFNLDVEIDGSKKLTNQSTQILFNEKLSDSAQNLRNNYQQLIINSLKFELNPVNFY